MLISLFGATAGQGVVWYTGQFYALFYLQTILKVHATSANYIVAIALLLGMPFFVVFGALSDRLGRKKIMMAGCLLAVIFYIPIYQAMQRRGRLERRDDRVAAQCRNGRDLADADDARGRRPPTGAGGLPVHRPDDAAQDSGAWTLILLVFVQVLFVTMVYGPIAAYLVEAFPARIRYTALSLPYHIGNGVFGGLLPLIGLYSVAATGNIYAGLYYPMAVAALTFIVGSLWLEDTHGVLIWKEFETETPGRVAPDIEAPVIAIEEEPTDPVAAFAWCPG